MDQLQMMRTLDEFIHDEGFEAACMALSDVCYRIALESPETSPAAQLWRRRGYLIAKLPDAKA